MIRISIAMFGFLAGCSTYEVASDVKLISFRQKPESKEASLGSISGRSCQWRVFGWPLGEDPSIRHAFENAAVQKDGAAIPGINDGSTASPDKVMVLRDVGTDRDFMSLYIVGRSCVNVHGLGAM